jgi:hypothetical protein
MGFFLFLTFYSIYLPFINKINCMENQTKLSTDEVLEIKEISEVAQKLLRTKVTQQAIPLLGGDIKQLIEDERLDLNPWFQRGDVWDKSQQIKLVDSFMSNTPIPAIYLEMYKRDEDGFEYYRVVDGKQRLSSLKEYLENNLEISYEGQPNSFWKGKKWKKEPKVNEHFRKCKLPVIVLDTQSCSEEERESIETYVFQRWNDSSALTQAEIRNSFKSDVNNLIINCGLLDFCLEGVGKKVINRQNKRKELNEILERLIYRFYDTDISHTHPNHKILMKFHKTVLNSEKLENIKKEIIWAVTFLSNNEKVVQATKTINLNMKIDLIVLLVHLRRIYGKSRIEEKFGSYLNDFVELVIRFKKLSKNPENLNDEEKEFLLKYNRFFEVFRGGVNGNNKFRFETELELFNHKYGLKTLDSTRLFDRETKEMVWLQQGGKCKLCDTKISLTESEADHIDEHKEGGQSVEDNCQVLCQNCHKQKTKEYVSNL